MIGAASGVASLDGSKLVPTAQIPFGATPGKVADGGALAATLATANAAVPSAMLGAAAGVATLDANKLLPSAQVPFGTTAGSVADGGALATTSAKAASALQPANIGSTGTNGVSAYNDPRITGAAPSSGAVLTNAKLAADPAAGDTSTDVVDAGWVTRLVSASGGTATTVGSGTDLSQGNITPTGSSTPQSAAAIGMLAQHAVQPGSSVTAPGTPITWNPVAAPGETGGRPAGTRAGDVYNLADHGADGTAANDDTALNKAIAYAAARGAAGGYTTIYLPQNINGQPWAFTSAPTSGGFGVFGFGFPSNTEFAGAGINATSITWNDANGKGWYLFGSSSDVGAAGSSGRTQNLTFRDFKVIGTWGPNGTYVANAGAILPDNVDGLTIRNVESDYSRGFGLGTGNSTNVIFDGDLVNTSYADGISARGTSNLEMVNLQIMHTNDDCLSAHEETGVIENVRRDILIGNVQCFDTQGVDIAAPLHLSINNVRMTTPKGYALVIASQGTSGSSEGASSIAGVAVSNFYVTNMIQRGAVDNYNGAGQAIIVFGGAPARGNASGTTLPSGQSGASDPTALPGESTPGHGYIRDPYPEWMTNSNNASLAMNGTHAIAFQNIVITRTFPGADGKAADGSDSRFPNFASFGQGVPIAAYAAANPTPTENNFREVCFQINGAYIRDMSITGLTCDGEGDGVWVNIGTGTNKIDGLSVDDSHFYDLTGPGILTTVSPTSTLLMEVRNSDFDLDPYDRGYRVAAPVAVGTTAPAGTVYGGWTGVDTQYCGYVAFCNSSGAGGVLVLNNTIKNAASDTNVDTTSTTTGWVFRNNYDYAQIAVPYAYSANNLGVGFVHPGFEIIPIDANPNDQAYDSITSTKPSAAPAMPTTGMWHQGDYVRNTAPTASSPVKGWLRLTTGTGSTLGTDWVADHAQ